MSKQPPTSLTPASDELWRLTAAMCHGTLTAAEAEELECMLRDPAAREFYVAYLSLHARLLWRGWEDNVAPAAVPSALVAPSLVTRGVAWMSHPWRLSIAVAAILMVSLILTSAQIYLPDQPAADETDRIATDRAPPGAPWAAVWQFGVDARWAAATPRATGQEARIGQLNELVAGQAELLFATGVSVRIQGPTRLEVLSADRLRVEQGTLLARVPRPAIGFTVAVEDARIVDLGTEFGVTANERGNYEAHVFEGQVRVERADDSDDSVILSTNQAIQGRGEGRPWRPVAASAAPFASLRVAEKHVQFVAELSHQRPFDGQGWQLLSRRPSASVDRGFRAWDSHDMLMMIYERQESRRDTLFRCADQRIEVTVSGRHVTKQNGFVGGLLRVQPGADGRSGFYMARIVEFGRELRLSRDLDSLAETVRFHRPYRDGERWRLAFEAKGSHLSAHVYDQEGTLQGEIHGDDAAYAHGTLGLRLAGPWAVAECRGQLTLPLPAGKDEPLLDGKH